MLYQLEVWHLVVSISASIVGIGLAIFGRGFTSWSNRLKDMGKDFHDRLVHMEEKQDRRWDEVERKMERHEKRMDELHVTTERRITYIEAQMRFHTDD